MKHIILFTAALGLAACATPIAPAPVRADGLATIGQPTRVGQLVVTPQAVVEDSRCPINARCIWAGRLVLATRIDGAGWGETTNLTLGKPYTTHGVGLALMSAEPGRLAGMDPPHPAVLFSFEQR